MEEGNGRVPAIKRLKTSIFDHRGLFAAFVASLCFAGQSVCVKLLKDSLPVIEVVCLRFLLQGFFSVMVSFFSETTIISTNSMKETLLLFSRGIFGTVAIGLIYFAVYNMSAGMVNAIVFGAPVFVGIFAWIILRERLYICDVCLMVINILGIFLIAQPPFLFPTETLDTDKKMELFAVAAAVIAMLLSALTSIFIRLLGFMGTNAVKIVLYYSLCGTVLPALAGCIMQDWVLPPCGQVRFTLVLIGLLNFLAQSLISFALAASKQSYFVSVINSSQVPFTIFLELIILGVAPGLISGAGMVVVLLSVLGVVVREMMFVRKKKEEAHETDAPVEEDC
ncbi:putative solute carrier family 35 member G1 [Apostichopus japonicus]|uniref:Putative solute carrier family 35 member G1 n=1 Tax=Stichopus japonicus TaxID=307972 RepID=A0A2G8JJH1_STIJA|nr:putative solute carrier family 35 member G1 [Apostichopus japonicus]